MRRLSILVVSGVLAVLGVASAGSAQPPTPPPGCAIALEAIAQTPAAAPGMAAVAARCPG